jgi:hypothetical protein
MREKEEIRGGEAQWGGSRAGLEEGGSRAGWEVEVPAAAGGGMRTSDLAIEWDWGETSEARGTANA